MSNVSAERLHPVGLDWSAASGLGPAGALGVSP
jgi:hypothetical protein